MWKYIAYVAFSGVIIYYTLEFCRGCEYNPDIRLDGKIAIVTGANSGIGKETAEDLAQRGAKVYLGCRSLDRGRAAVDQILASTGVDPDLLVILHLDLASLESVRHFVAEYKQLESSLDILINNGGIMFPANNQTVDGYEVTFATNYLGHFLLTHLLTDILISSSPSRVVHVSSVAHMLASLSLDDLSSSRFAWWGFAHHGWAYIHSKLSNILFSNELAVRLEGTGVVSVSLHPGSVVTNFPSNNWMMRWIYTVFGFSMKDVYHGARTSIYCAIDPDIEHRNGGYFSDCGASSPSSAAQSDSDARRLWDVSIDLVHLSKDEIHPKLVR